MKNIKLIAGGASVLLFIILLFTSYQKGKEIAKNECVLQENIETIKIQEKIIYVKQNQEKLVANIKNVNNNKRLEFLQHIWQEREDLY